MYRGSGFSKERKQNLRLNGAVEVITDLLGVAEGNTIEINGKNYLLSDGQLRPTETS